MRALLSEDPHFDVWIVLVRTRDAICKARQKELDPQNIQLRQAAVLHAIDAIGEEATAAKISRYLGRESHSISELLSRMSKKGLVRKVRNLERKNWARIVLAENGREVYAQAEKRETVGNIMSCLNAEESKQLRANLMKVYKAANKELARLSQMRNPS
ncbi:MarR family winged helix-turn-helix transcriptional regulator [Chloroflexota bacterium]